MGEKKSNKKKIVVISLIILLLAVIGATAFILIRGQLNRSTYRESIQTAEKQVTDISDLRMSIWIWEKHLLQR